MDQTPPLTPAVLRRFLKRFCDVRYCPSIVGDGDEDSFTREQFAGWERLCTAAYHSPPNDDGVCGECTDDPEWLEQHPPVEPVPYSDNEEGGDDSNEDDSDGRSPWTRPEDTCCSPLTLEQTEREYPIALQAAGPWVEPPICPYPVPRPPDLAATVAHTAADAIHIAWSVLGFASGPARIVRDWFRR